MKLPIYLDYSATTPVDPRVVDADDPVAARAFRQPGVAQPRVRAGTAEKAVEEAREQVAALVNCDPREIVWTSGATESINLALKGAAHFYKDKGKHLVTVKTEHKATLDTMRELEREGFEVTYLDVEEDGLLDLESVQGGAAAGHDPGLGDVRQQRDRRDPGHRGDRRDLPRARASSSTSTRRRRPARSPIDLAQAARST